jgi:hypothetical protein
VSDHVSHPCKTTDKIIVLYLSVFTHTHTHTQQIYFQSSFWYYPQQPNCSLGFLFLF